MIDWIWTGAFLYDLALAACALVAWRWGGFAEQLCMAIIVIGSGVSALVLPVAHAMGVHAVYLLTPIDLLVLIAFDQVMVRSRSTVAIWVEGFQLAAVAISVGQMWAPVASRPYLRIQGKFAYAMLAAIVICIWLRRRRPPFAQG